MTGFCEHRAEPAGSVNEQNHGPVVQLSATQGRTRTVEMGILIVSLVKDYKEGFKCHAFCVHKHSMHENDAAVIN